jgi:hypothetical protein
MRWDKKVGGGGGEIGVGEVAYLVPRRTRTIIISMDPRIRAEAAAYTHKNSLDSLGLEWMISSSPFTRGWGGGGGQELDNF